jgi:DNA-binding response OmpR family regulator
VHILLVEDHADTRRALSKLLIHYGHNVASAENVRDALHLLDTIQFDAFLSDIGLPDGDGLALVQEAKRRQKFRATVAITALASADDRQRGLRAGFDHYLTKPLEVRRLRAVLHQTAEQL